MKKVYKLIGIIVVGALGSMLWEVGLSPLFHMCFQGINYVLVLLSSGYENNIYKMASYGFYEGYSLNLYIMLYVVMISAYFILFIYSEQFHRDRAMRTMTSEKLKIEIEKSKLMSLELSKILNKKLLGVGLIFLIIIGLYQGTIHTTVNRVVTETRNNIEIVAPYIEDNEYKGLYSEFYNMDSKADYNKLKGELTTIYEKTNMNYKEFPSNMIKY